MQKHNILICAGSALALVGVSTIANAAYTAVKTFYVSPKGNDANDGSQKAPWLTIQHAANSVTAGNTVYVLAGIYHESVTLSVSGSAKAGPIQFISSPIGKAIIDGTGVPCCGHTNYRNITGLFNINGQSYVTIKGFDIRNYTTSDPLSQPGGIINWGAGSYIKILNNKVHNITTTAGQYGNANGIGIYGASATPIDHLTINDNEIYNLKTGNTECLTVSSNVTNFTVSGNEVHDNDNIGIEIAGFWGPAPAGVMCGADLCDRARNGLVQGNLVYNVTSYGNPAYGNIYASSGINVDGGTKIIIEQNIIHNADFGVAASSENPGNETPGLENASHIIVRNNLIYDNNAAGITIGGYNSTRGGTDNCSFVNNTLYHNDSKANGNGEFQIQYYATNNIFKNNIVYAGAGGLFIYSWTNSVPDPVVADYNDYWSTAGAASSAWRWNSTLYTDYSSYLAASGNDAHSKFADPLFLNLVSPDLRVSSTSPVINAAANLGTVIIGDEDFAGHTRVRRSKVDIGAYERW